MNPLFHPTVVMYISARIFIRRFFNTNKDPNNQILPSRRFDREKERWVT